MLSSLTSLRCWQVVHDNGVTFVYVKYNNLYLLAVTKRNANAAVIVLFLYRLVQVGSP